MRKSERETAIAHWLAESIARAPHFVKLDQIAAMAAVFGCAVHAGLHKRGEAAEAVEYTGNGRRRRATRGTTVSIETPVAERVPSGCERGRA